MGAIGKFHQEQKKETAYLDKKQDLIGKRIPFCVYKVEETFGEYEGRPTHDFRFHFVAVHADKVYKQWFSLPYNEDRAALVQYVEEQGGWPQHNLLLCEVGKRKYQTLEEAAADNSEICPCAIADGMQHEHKEARRESEVLEPEGDLDKKGSVTPEQLEAIEANNASLWKADMPTVQLPGKRSELTYHQALNIIKRQETLMQSVKVKK